MKIVVNGSDKQIKKNTSVSDLITSYSLDIDRVIILKNDLIIPKETYDIIRLEGGDKVELLSIVGGG